MLVAVLEAVLAVLVAGRAAVLAVAPAPVVAGQGAGLAVVSGARALALEAVPASGAAARPPELGPVPVARVRVQVSALEAVRPVAARASVPAAPRRGWAFLLAVCWAACSVNS